MAIGNIRSPCGPTSAIALRILVNHPGDHDRIDRHQADAAQEQPCNPGRDIRNIPNYDVLDVISKHRIRAILLLQQATHGSKCAVRLYADAIICDQIHCDQIHTPV